MEVSHLLAEASELRQADFGKASAALIDLSVWDEALGILVDEREVARPAEAVAVEWSSAASAVEC